MTYGGSSLFEMPERIQREYKTPRFIMEINFCGREGGRRWIYVKNAKIGECEAAISYEESTDPTWTGSDWTGRKKTNAC